LMSVHDEEGNILAALGFRYAGDERLFLETYLDAPIERVLEEVYKQPINRNVIAEIGNLASQGGRSSIFLFTALDAYLEKQGIKINTVTATDSLLRYFNHLGLKATELAKANQKCLGDSGVSWGSYYKENPRVVAGYVDQSLSRLREYLQIVLEANTTRMQARIHHTNVRVDIVCE